MAIDAISHFLRIDFSTANRETRRGHLFAAANETEIGPRSTKKVRKTGTHRPLEWMEQLVTKRRQLQQQSIMGNMWDDSASLVACAGMIGVVWATSWVYTKRKSWSLWGQLLVLIVMPLVLVEVSLVLVGVPNLTDSTSDWMMMPRVQ